jgi:ABC-type multidrug transport system fused ATPase/permease subunit
LDFLGILLTFVVAILTVGTRFSISPSQTGVTLSYIISVQQAFGWLVRQSAEVENNMNSVERIVSCTEIYLVYIVADDRLY